MKTIFSIANGRYLLVDIIGEGGMATVYRGFDQRLGVWRAIKVLAPHYAGKKKVLSRFDAEARTMALLEQDHIVRVYDVGEFEGVAYIVMEMVVGGTLVDWLERHGPMPPKRAVDVTIEICKAIGYAHGKGVIHRDIKPHNVLIHKDGVCRVTDFGIARMADESQSMTKTGAVMGTWGYMAPEQRTNSKGVDERGDLYAIGATLYTLVTNRMPVDLFAADRDEGLLDGVAELLVGPIRKATQYNREDRHESVADFKDALAQIRKSLPDDPPDTPSLVSETSAIPEMPKQGEIEQAVSLSEHWAQQNAPLRNVKGQTLLPVDAPAGGFAPTMAPGEWAHSDPAPEARGAPTVLRQPSAPAPAPVPEAKRRSPFVWVFASSPGVMGVALMLVASVIAVPKMGWTIPGGGDVEPDPIPELDTEVVDAVIPDKPEPPAVETDPDPPVTTTRRRRQRTRVTPPPEVVDTPPVVPDIPDPPKVEQCVQVVQAPGDLRPGETLGFKVRLCDGTAGSRVYLYYRAVGGSGNWQKRPMTNLGGMHSFSVQVSNAYQEGMEYYIETDGAQIGSQSSPKFIPTVHL